jgi:UDPglucose--hexose-1-phosphate uridylyltransferase
MPSAPPPSHPFLSLEPVHGACDVIVFHPRHDLTLSRLPVTEIERIIDEWIRIYTLRGAQEGIKYVQIFEVSCAVFYVRDK